MRHGLGIVALVLGWMCLEVALADDAERLRSWQGEWGLTRLEIDGTAIEVKEIAEFSVSVSGDRLKYRFIVSGQPTVAEFQVSIDPKANPPQIDAVLLGGAWQGKTLTGLYELQGDSLTLCLPDRPGLPRPMKLGSNRGSEVQLIGLMRRAK